MARTSRPNISLDLDFGNLSLSEDLLATISYFEGKSSILSPQNSIIPIKSRPTTCDLPRISHRQNTISSPESSNMARNSLSDASTGSTPDLESSNHGMNYPFLPSSRFGLRKAFTAPMPPPKDIAFVTDNSFADVEASRLDIKADQVIKDTESAAIALKTSTEQTIADKKREAERARADYQVSILKSRREFTEWKCTLAEQLLRQRLKICQESTLLFSNTGDETGTISMIRLKVAEDEVRRMNDRFSTTFALVEKKIKEENDRIDLEERIGCPLANELDSSAIKIKKDNEARIRNLWEEGYKRAADLRKQAEDERKQADKARQRETKQVERAERSLDRTMVGNVDRISLVGKAKSSFTKRFSFAL